MPQSAEADTSQANATTGTGAGSDGTGTEGRKPDDQEMVPLARLNQVIDKLDKVNTNNSRLETEVARTQGRLDALTEQGSKGGEVEKEYTASELRRMIENEEITQPEADDIIQKQTNNRIEKRVDDEVHKRTTVATAATKITTEIDRYVTAQPDAAVTGSDIHTKVAQEYTYLLGMGHEPTQATQLSALRAALGPVEKLNAATPGKGERETHQETSGAGDPDTGDEKSGSEGGWPKEMDRDTRKFYDDLVTRGVYADKQAAIDEFKYEPKHRSRR